MILDIFVPGRPRTKGSLKPIINWAAQSYRMVEQVGESSVWRRMVSDAAVLAISDPAVDDDGRPIMKGRKQMRRLRVGYPFDCAVRVTCIAAFEREHDDADEYPIKIGYGDSDKLLRNVLDALTDAKVYRDDCLVTTAYLRKTFVGGRLEQSGIHIMVTECGE